MSKIFITEFVSLDGVFEDPGGAEKFKYGGWSMPYGNEEFFKFKLDELKKTDALLLGRITYEEFAKAWPGRTDEVGFADKFNTMPKYVVSNSLTHADWNNSHIIKGKVGEIERLKKRGGTIAVHGSGTLARFLIEKRLVDELSLLVYPVVLGTGKRLFEGLSKTALELVVSKHFSTGVVFFKYKLKK